MKFVITGANSFIGAAMARKISQAGWESILVVRPGREIEPLPHTKILSMDMRDYSKLGELTGPCDCFLHLVWRGTRGPLRTDREIQQENVSYSLQGIESMLRVGCGRVVLAGSQAEYGLQLELTSERAVCMPHTEYGKAKLALSQQTAELCIQKNVDYKLLRIFSVYGPGDYSDTMIMSILNDMLKNNPCKLTQCTQQWDFLYVSDAVEAIFRLCSAPCSNGVYNIASGDVRPLKSFVEEMYEVTHSASHLLFGALPYSEMGRMSLWPDVSKLKHELCWEPTVTFERGIQDIINRL